MLLLLRSILVRDRAIIGGFVTPAKMLAAGCFLTPDKNHLSRHTQGEKQQQRKNHCKFCL